MSAASKLKYIVTGQWLLAPFTYNWTKFIKTFHAQPYVSVNMYMDIESNLKIDSDYNRFFIFYLDNLYELDDAYEKTWEDEAKIRWYLFDIAYGMARDILPPEPKPREPTELEMHEQMPPMSWREGKNGDVQTIDLAEVPRENILASFGNPSGRK